MKLYSEDFQTLSDQDRATWEDLKQKEIVYRNGKPTAFRRSQYRNYPKSVRHYLSLFPNNLVDAVELSKDKEHLEALFELFNKLLDDVATAERSILNFIRQNQAYFLIGSILQEGFMFGHHALYLFPEFRMPPNFQADYLIVGQNSAGHHFVFVELENPYGDITLNDGSYGVTIRKGIKQCEDWEMWLEQNFSHLRLVFEQVKNKAEALPWEFSLFDKTRVHYVVVAGRRSDYFDRTYRLRRSQQQRQLLILHYDNLLQLAKKAIGGPTY